MPDIAGKIRELSEKYALAQVTDVKVGEKEVVLETKDQGKIVFSWNFEKGLKADEVPLYPWRARRGYQEMANLLKAGTVEVPLAIRVKNVQRAGKYTAGLKSVLLREIDLSEQLLCGDRMIRVFSDVSDKLPYMNALCATEKGIKISMELGVTDTREPVELHEVVCRSGIITDTSADTQVRQYPIYLYKKDGEEVSIDTDYELYDFPEDDRDAVRFILKTLSQKDGGKAVRADYDRQMKLAAPAMKGGMCE